MITSLLLVLCLPLMWGEVATAPVGRNCEVKNTDVIFVLDSSSSIKDPDFQETLRFVTKFVDDIPVIGKTGTQIGIYTFGTNFKNEIELGRHQDKKSLKSAIMAIKSNGGATDTNLVLDDVRLNGFSARSDARTNVQRAVVVITDGESTHPELTKIAASKLHKEDIFTFAVGVGTHISKDELVTIASTKNSVSYVKDFEALKTIESKVNQVICDHRKLLCTTKAADVIFVLDSSDSVKDNNFTAYIEFLTNFVNDAEIGPQNIQVGVFLFADNPSLEIRLDEFYDKAKLIDRIKNMKRVHGATYTDKALQNVRTRGFDQANGGRGKNADQIVIVITDGESILPQNTKFAAQALRAMNVEIYAVGIGQVNNKELNDISSGSADHVRMVEDFKSLSDIEDHLFKKVCSKESVDEGQTTPSNGEITTYSPNIEPYHRNCKTDIIFVLDTSGSIKDPDFKEMLQFVLKFVDASPMIGKTGTQVGIYTFNTDFRYEIQVGKYQEKEALKSAIMSIRRTLGATWTHLVLDDVLKNGFRIKDNVRPNVQRVVVVITDGESEDPQKTKMSASALHQANIITFAVGVGKNSGKFELHDIASADDYVSCVKNFQALDKVEKQINSVICDQKSLLCSVVPLDVVFVLDSSDSVRDRDFEKEIDFVTAFTTHSKIGPKDVQISLFTYADKSNFQIKLNDFKNKKELLQKLKRIQRDHGFTNTDIALTNVRMNAFTSANGGRGSDAKQVVIVFTDGGSLTPNATKAAADALHSMNVEVFSLGIGKDVDVVELHNIASSVQNVHTVPNFESLKKIEKRILKKVCVSDKTVTTPSPIVCTTTPSDVIFVLDSSDSVNKDDFKTYIEFLTKFVMSAEIGPQKTQVGVFLYADDSSLFIRLDELNDKAKLVERIRNMKRIHGATYTDKALQDVLSRGFKPTNGGRGSKANQIAIVITDGESISPEDTKTAAQTLRAMNVEIYAIGIGKTNVAELHAISSDVNHVRTVPDFKGLSIIEKRLFKEVCTRKSVDGGVTPSIGGTTPSNGDVTTGDGNTDVTSTIQPNIVCSVVPLDVVFVLDSSDSVRDRDFKKEIDFVTAFTTHSKIGPKDVQISLFTYADKSNFQIKLNDFKNKKELLQKLKRIQRDHGFTNTDIALTNVRMNAFTSANGGRGSDAKQVVIVFTDGGSLTPNATKAAADALHSMNVEVFSLGIGKDVDVVELHNIASSVQNVHTVPNFESLKKIEKRILKKVCVSDKTVTTPSPIVCTTTPSDVIFVLDSSDSVNKDDFKTYIEFLTKFVMSAEIGPQKTQVGVFLYADDSSLFIRLDELNDKVKLVERIRNMKRIHGATYTDKALQDVLSRGFKPANGGRGSKANQIAIVLTDGESISPEDTKTAAQALRAMNVEIYAIGIGKTNVAELHAISSDVNHVRTVPDFKSLSIIEKRLFKEVCTRKSVDGGVTPSIGGTTPSNGDVTTGDGNTDVTSTIQPNIVCSVVPLDVVFVLDSSDSLRDRDFEKEIDFVTTFTTHSKIGPKDVQISLFTYADKSNFQIKLNDFKNKKELLQKLKRIQRDHGFTNTDIALTNVRMNAFTSANGGRGSDAKQVVIVFTDGGSLTPNATKAAADALHSMNVEVFSLGIGKDVDVVELHNIASSVQNVHTVPNFESLKKIEKRILKKVCVSDKTVTTPSPIVCTTTPSDVIFILDSSDSVNKDDFKTYIEFLTKFVMSAEIGPQKTQVGVFLYADDSSLFIRLDELNDKVKLVERIRNMKRIHGATYTDKALQDVLSRGFKPANGGRGSKANQIAIVITDGESISPEDTKTAAQALRAMNVEIYAIGIGKTNVAELHAISSDVNHVRTVPDFKGLSIIEKRLFKEVCTRKSVDGGVTPSIGGTTPSNGDVTTGDGNTDVTSTIQPNIECNKDSKKMADVVILLDNSDSLSDDFFKEEVKMVNKLIASHTIGPNDVQVAVVTFADKATEVFNLKQKVGKFQRSSGSTNTAGALNLALKKSFLPSSGARPASHKVVIVITDGTSDDEYETQRAVKALRATGVNIFSIGIGSADIFELRQISGDRSKVFMAMDSSGIDNIGNRIFDGKCGPVNPGKTT